MEGRDEIRRLIRGSKEERVGERSKGGGGVREAVGRGQAGRQVGREAGKQVTEY